MKKILIIARIDQCDISTHGILEKIKSQRKGFERLGHQADILTYSPTHIWLNNTPICTIKIGNSLWFKWYTFFETLKERLPLADWDLVYIRYGLSSPTFISFLKKAKSQNSTLKIAVEIPTFPYAKEWEAWYSPTALAIDRYYRRQSKQYVDVLIGFTKDTHVFGIPHISITNGANTSPPPTLKFMNSDLSTLNLIGVGKWRSWHGIDLILDGIAKYKQCENSIPIRLKLIGTSKESKNMTRKIAKLGLAKEVELIESLYGHNLDDLYNWAHLALGSLALHRKDVTIDSSLKHREYCLRGIPFVIKGEDLDFPSNWPFVYSLPKGNRPLPIAELVEYRNTLCKKHARQSISSTMRDYAITNLAWDTRMEKVVHFLWH